jgi:hypothetical protein
VLVQLDVDGDHEIVLVNLRWFNDVRVLTRSIEALTEIQDHLPEMFPDGSRREGRCMATVDWGHCTLDDGQWIDGEDHKFPTEDEWRARQATPLPRTPDLQRTEPPAASPGRGSACSAVCALGLA